MKIKSFTLLFIIMCVLMSCKKGCKNMGTSISDTQWELHFKNNNTFTFYALSHLYFKKDNTIDNYRNFDTLNGTWNQDNSSVTIDFTNGDNYTGSLASSDSMSGTLSDSGNDGVWYALKK